MQMLDKGALSKAIESARGGAVESKLLVPYLNPPDGRNEAVFFLKPELTSDPAIDLDAVLRLVEERLGNFSVEVVGAAVLSGQYLEKHNVMARHYGAINKVSREGRAALPPAAIEKLKTDFGRQLSEGAEVLGGHQFLGRFPFFTPEALSVLWDNKNSGSVKLSSGVYAIDYVVLDKKAIVLNGFHPFQLRYFTAPGKSIALFVVRSKSPWKVLRNDLIGLTDPIQAASNSIRKQLLEHREAWKLGEINKGLNGVHLSAGPVEGYLEIVRFFGGLADVGKCANLPNAGKGMGISTEQLASLESNPMIKSGGTTRPLFDATEEMDMKDALELLSQVNG